MRNMPGAFRGPAVAVAAFAAALPCLLSPAAAYAARTAVPGGSGDVKIQASGTSFVDQSSEPHVCAFSLAAAGFDPVQQVTWSITEQAPTGGAVVATDRLMLVDGGGTSADLDLPAGHYRLAWNIAGENGGAKHKDFWSDCAGAAAPPPGSTVVAADGSVVGTVDSAGRIIAPNGTVVGLAATGSDPTPWVLSAGALALSGLWLIRRARRRRAQ